MTEREPQINTAGQPAFHEQVDTSLTALTPYQRLPEELERDDYDPQEITQDIKVALKRVRSQMVNRDGLLTQTLLALLTREHQLIYSRPGTAKSLYADAVFEQFSDATTYKIQMTKGTTEDTILGGVDMKRFVDEGQLFRNTEGGIVEANFAMVDEIFDGNDPALRSTLGVLNERRYVNGRQVEQANLHTGIATTNYVRETKTTEAVLDRFMFKAFLTPDADPYTMLRIDATYDENHGEANETPDEQKVTYGSLNFLSRLVEGRVDGKKITVPHHVLLLKNLLILNYKQRVDQERREQGKPELYISPRTIAKARKILNASALLNNRMNVSTNDLDSLKYLVCTIGNGDNQEKHFTDAKNSLLRQFSEDDLEIVDYMMGLDEQFDEFLNAYERGEKPETHWVEKVLQKLKRQTVSDLGYNDFVEAVTLMSHASHNQEIKNLKNSIIARINREKRNRTGSDEDHPLLF